jgi:GntR family transcriptional regulator, arabinose operon transcriptional repressor
MTEQGKNRKFVYAKLEADLRKAILNNEFDPKTPLTGENELANKYKISRPSARKALQALVNEGLLIRKRGEGTFVVPPEERKLGIERRNLHIAIGLAWLRDGIAKYDNDFLEGAAEYAYRGGHQLSYFDSHEFDPDRLISLHKSGKLDAIAWSSIPNDNLKMLDKPDLLKIPQVLLHRKYKDFPCLTCDNEESVRKSLMFLLGFGHKKIGFINCSQDLVVYNERENGFFSTLKKAGIKNSRNYYLRIPNTELESRFEPIKSWINKLDSIIVGGHSFLVPFLNWLNDQNIKIPDDLSLVCIDDSFTARTYTVPISVYSSSRFEQGKQTIHVIESLVKGQLIPGEKVIFRGELIIRDSCKPLNL